MSWRPHPVYPVRSARGPRVPGMQPLRAQHSAHPLNGAPETVQGNPASRRRCTPTRKQRPRPADVPELCGVAALTAGPASPQPSAGPRGRVRSGCAAARWGWARAPGAVGWAGVGRGALRPSGAGCVRRAPPRPRGLGETPLPSAEGDRGPRAARRVRSASRLGGAPCLPPRAPAGTS